MFLRLLVIAAIASTISLKANAQDAAINSAISAGPASLTKNATIKDWKGNVLRKGTNGWTCLPDNPANGEVDPMCVDSSWSNFLSALTNKKKPDYDKVGIAYMLVGFAPKSNITPAGKKEDGDWVENLKAHLMILVPDHKMFDNISTNPNNGGPWAMWTGTPYAHIMVPIDSYPSE